MADPLDILTGTVRPLQDEWSNTLANIANVVASIPQRRRQAMMDARADEDQQMQREAYQQKVDDLKALDAAFSQPGGRESVLSRVPGHLRGTVAKQLAELDESNAKRLKAQEEARAAGDDTIARGLTVVRHHNYEPEFAQGTISTLKGYYQDDPQRLKELQLVEASIHENPTREHVKMITDALIKRSGTQVKTDTEAAKGVADVASTEALTAERQQKVAGKEPIQPTKQAELAAAAENAAATRALTEQARAETARHNRAMEGNAAKRLADEDATPGLTPEGLDAVALSFAKTGQLPPLGMGKKSTDLREQIINRAAQMNPALDLASNRAAFQANQGALTGLQKQRDAIGAFEQTAQKNIDIFLQQAGKVVDTGSPLANKLVREISGSVLGSPDVSAFNAARQVAVNEIAKITTNPNLTGQLTDTARKEVEAFNPASATLKQSVEVMRILKRDMDNRVTALDQQINAIKSRIKGGTSEPAAAPNRIKVSFDKDGNLIRQ